MFLLFSGNISFKILMKKITINIQSENPDLFGCSGGEARRELEAHDSQLRHLSIEH